MSTTTLDGRQYTLNALVSLDSDNAADGVKVNLPAGAFVTAGNASIVAVFDGTTPAFTAKDNGTSPTSFFGDVDATAAGNTNIADGLGNYYPAGAEVTFAVSGAPTKGQAIISLTYLVKGRVNESFAG